MLCCLLAALFASPLLLWRAPNRPHGVMGGGAWPLALTGVSLAAGAALLCMLVFTAPGAVAFRNLCSVAGWRN